MIDWLIQNCVLAALLTLLALCLCRFGRLAPATRHALWLIVLIKLVTPPIPLYHWPSFATPPPVSPDEGAARGRQDVLAVANPAPSGAVESASANDAAESIEWLVAPSEMSVESEARAPSSDAAVLAASLPTWNELRGWIVRGWMAASAVAVAVQLLRLRRLRRWLTESRPAPPWLEQLTADLAPRLEIAAPRVRVRSGSGSPLVCALFRPVLLWPEGLVDSLSNDARRTVCAHELAHLRRRDHWVGWLELAAGCLWWWNPVYWHARHQLRENAELACDAWVLALLPDDRRAYAQALVEVAQSVSWTPATAPAVGMGGSARRTFERRLTMILRERVAARAPFYGLAAIGLVGLAILPGWSAGQAPAVAPDSVLAQPAPEESPNLPTDPAPDELSPATESIVVADEQEIAPQPHAAGVTLPEPTILSNPPDANRPTAGQYYVLERPASRPAAARSDQELQHIRALLTQLTAEIQTLHSRVAHGQGPVESPIRPSTIYTRDPTYGTSGQPPQFVSRLPIAVTADPDVQTLTRAKYRLNAAKAEALAEFVKAHVTAEVDTKVEGDLLIVTAAPDIQQRIGQFVKLMQESPKTAPPQSLNPPGASSLAPADAVPATEESPNTVPRQ